MIPITNFTGRLGNQMFQYAYLYAQVKKGNLPDIYLQDEEYFKEYADEIKQVFGEGIGYLPFTAIHVRRGDYVNNPFYVDLFANGYYQRAIAEFPGASFLVFSDDIEFCKQQEVFNGFQFAEGGTEIEDMNMMASCANQIIGNSTFSWWAAYLNPNPAKKIIAPNDWFGDGRKLNLPKSWQLI